MPARAFNFPPFNHLRRPRAARGLLLLAAAAAGLAIAPARAQNLTVDQSRGDSPYLVTDTQNSGSWSVVVIGQGVGGEIDQSGGVFSIMNLVVGQAGSGAYYLSGGSLALTGSINVGSSQGSSFNVSGGTATVTNQFFLATSAATTFNQTGGTFDASASGGFFVGNEGAGTMNLSGSTSVFKIDNLYLANYSAGTVNLDGGLLTAGQVGIFNAGNARTSTFNFNGGTLQAAQDNAAFLSGLTTANVRNGGAVFDTNGHAVTVSQALLHSAISGDNATDGGLTKNGLGTLTLTGANTYTGATTLNAGTLSVAADGNLGAAGANLNFNGGTLQVTGTAFTTTARTIGWGVNGGGIDVAAAGNTFELSQSLSNGGTLTKLGAGTLLLDGSGDNVNLGAVVNAGTLVLAKTSSSNPNVHAIGNPGVTVNSGGTLQLGGSGGDQIYDGATVTVNTGGTFDLAGNSETIQTLNGTGGTIQNSGTSAGSLTVGDGGTYAGGMGVHTGTGLFSLTKTGNGTLRLTGTLSMTTTTAVNGGALVVNGSAAGGFGVASGATLGGTGTLAGAVTVASGGTLAPGDGAGRLTTHNSVTLAGGAMLSLAVGGAAAGTGYDQLVCASLDTTGHPNLALTLVNGFAPAVGEAFYVVDTASGNAADYFGNATGAAHNLFTDAVGDVYQINYGDTDPNDPRIGGTTGDDVSLTVIGVPEPSTRALALAGERHSPAWDGGGSARPRGSGKWPARVASRKVRDMKKSRVLAVFGPQRECLHVADRESFVSRGTMDPFARRSLG